MSQSHLTVTVLIPSYNRANYLPDALNSLLAQTRIPDEIIVVDDGSTDNTAEVLARYGAPVRVIKQPNRGVSAARNVALCHTSADLVAFLDSDDVLPPHSIERRASFLETHPDTQLVYTAATLEDMNGNTLGWFLKPPLPRGHVFGAIVCRSIFPIHAAMFRRDSIAGIPWFDEKRSRHEDLEFWRRLAVQFPFEVINEALAVYRLQPNQSIMTNLDQQIKEEIQLRQAAFTLPAFAGLTPAEKARAYSVHASQYFLLGDSATARRWYLRAIRTAPTMPRPYLLLGLTIGGKRSFDYAIRLQKRLRGSATTVEG